MKISRNKNIHMTGKQYSSLRKLFILWLRVALFKKYDVVKNLFIVFLVCINIYIIKNNYNYTNSILKTTADGTTTNNAKQIYDLKNFSSIKDNRKSLISVYNSLRKKFNNDTMTAEKFRYNKNGQLDDDWKRNCVGQIKKIIILKTRINDIETAIGLCYVDQKDSVDNAFVESRYQENLSDMSNYYSKFIHTDDYNYILKSLE